MKAKLFYDHLIIIEEIVAVLDEHKVKAKEKEKILRIIDRTLEHEIMDVIFTYLPKAHHEEFLRMFHASPHDPRLLSYLTDHSTVNIELAILDRANKTKRKFLKEVKRHIISSDA